MQAAHMLGDNLDNGHNNLKNRSIFNVCDLHSGQPGIGSEYGGLAKSFQITICDFTVFDDDRLIHRYSMRDKNGAELLDSIHVLFVELTKLGGVLKKPVQELSGAETWAIFLKYSNNPKYTKLLDEIIAAKEEIRMANTILNNISTNEDERAKFRARRKFQLDAAHDRAYLIRIGEENLLKGKLEIARNLIRRGRPLAEIIEDTGLSREEIENLRASE
jgi:predicted transposase/invertase (TIGR01784 family)